MDLTPEVKQDIDNMTIYDLLHRTRFSPVGDSIFQGESGIYLLNCMKELRSKDNDAYVRASKEMGWQ